MSGSTAPNFGRASGQPHGAEVSGRARRQPGTARGAIVALALAAAAGLLVALLGGGAQVRSVAQLACFIAILFPLARISYAGVRVPRAVWLGAASAALCGFAVRHVALGISEHAFVVAQLEEDSLGAEAKIVRDRMRSAASGLSLLSVGTLSKKIATRQEADAVIRNQLSVDGVVWGSPRWLNVSLRMRPPIALKATGKASYATKLLSSRRVKDLVVITSVSGIGISSSRLPATGEFLGGLAEAWEIFPEALKGPDSEGEAELALRSLAAMKAPWTSNAHRALPMWMTGTYHLIRAVRGSSLQMGELRCALGSFEAARAQLRPGDNPELDIALNNNRAIALFLRGGMSDRASQVARGQALQMLDMSLKAMRGTAARQELAGSLQLLTLNRDALRGNDDEARDKRHK